MGLLRTITRVSVIETSTSVCFDSSSFRYRFFFSVFMVKSKFIIFSMENKLAILKGVRNENNGIISSVPYSIGRCRTANFIIAHVNVSRNHCQLVKEGGLWKVNDFSSSGTYVNGALVGKGQSATLNSGDCIRFGPVETNLCWTFYSLSSCTADLNVKSKPQAIIYSPSENNSLKERNCSNKVINLNDKLQDKSNEEQLGSENSDCDLTKIPDETELKTNQKGETGNNNASGELQDIEKHPFSTKVKNDEDKSESEKIRELTKELQQVQSALSDLEEKNNVLQGKLASETCNNSSIASAPAHLVENLTDLMETEFQCTICSELFVVAVTLSCTHTFCKYCINLWKKKQKTCPICRKKITNETRSLVVDNYIDKMVEKLSLELKLRRETIIKERSKSEPLKKRSKTKT